MSEAGLKSWGTIKSVEPPESEPPIFKHHPPRHLPFPKHYFIEYPESSSKDKEVGPRFNHPLPKDGPHHPPVKPTAAKKKHLSMLSRKRRSSLLGIVLVWFLLLAIFAVIAVGLWLAGTYDSSEETATDPPVIIHSSTTANWHPTTTRTVLYEVMSEVRFTYYNNDTLTFDPALIDKESPEYLWWENVFVFIIYGNIDNFVDVRIDYMIPGSIIVRFTCVFDNVTHHTYYSLHEYFLMFVDEDGIVVGSTLGIETDNEDDISGEWNEWQPWELCSATCDIGQRYRSRTCADTTCIGNSQEVNTCLMGSCAFWSDWGVWGSCSVSCGRGERVRVRYCNTGDTRDCEGLQTDVQECVDDQNCGPPWGAWGSCSENCGGGLQHRYRTCESDGECSRMSTSTAETRACNTQLCQDPVWDSWGFWTLCSRTCGGGTRSRTRQCGSGKSVDCNGKAIEEDNCNGWECPPPSTPVPPVWSEWTQWNICSKTCGGGQRIRTRECLIGICVGPGREVFGCNNNNCTNVLSLGEWGDWSACSKSCDRGIKQRQRYCSTCVGAVEYQNEPCNESPCVPVWSSWSAWSECPVTCGIGNRTRTRHCNGVAECEGQNIETIECDTGTICPTEWGRWSSCTVTCGTGEKIRSRYCTAGTCSQVEECHPIDCFIESEWSDWSPWGDCDVTCGGGIRQRMRYCTTGIGCYEGFNRDTSVCNDILCVKEVISQLTFVSYDAISIPYDKSISERGSTSHKTWEDRLISEFNHVYGEHSSYIRTIINDILTDFPTATLIVHYTNLYAGDPAIEGADLITLYVEYKGEYNKRFGVFQP